MSGKSIRLERIIDRETGRAFILPLDHGATMGPLPGLYSIKDTVAKAAAGGATAVLMHKGMVDAGHRGFGLDVGLILHLSAGSIYSASPDRKVIVSSVEEALRLGADAVSVHLNIGGDGEPQMLEAAGKIAADCAGWGSPFLPWSTRKEKRQKTRMPQKPVCGRQQNSGQTSLKSATRETRIHSARSPADVLCRW